MKRLLIATLSAALFAAACGTSGSGTDISLTAEASAAVATPAKLAGPVYREVTIPSGTSLSLTLITAVASDTSRVGDPISAELTTPVAIDGHEVLSAGTTVSGVVMNAYGAGRIEGRGQVAFRFTSVSAGGESYDVNTAWLWRQASATKGEDAAKIGFGAAAGAVAGAMMGGKKGAAEGAAVGGAAGTGLVLATKGDEVRLAPGTDVTTQLMAPLMVRLRLSN